MLKRVFRWHGSSPLTTNFYGRVSQVFGYLSQGQKPNLAPGPFLTFILSGVALLGLPAYLKLGEPYLALLQLWFDELFQGSPLLKMLQIVHQTVHN